MLTLDALDGCIAQMPDLSEGKAEAAVTRLEHPVGEAGVIGVGRLEVQIPGDGALLKS